VAKFGRSWITSKAKAYRAQFSRASSPGTTTVSSIQNMDSGYQRSRVGHIRSRLIPDPAVKHCDFGQLKPQVGRLIIQSSIYDQIVDFFKENQHSSKKIQRTIDDYLSYLSPGNPEETIYFGVSRKRERRTWRGNHPFIREELKGLKEASRFRSDKWNIYLIVYDLRTNEKPGYSYPEIASILETAYKELHNKIEVASTRRTVSVYFRLHRLSSKTAIRNSSHNPPK